VEWPAWGRLPGRCHGRARAVDDEPFGALDPVNRTRLQISCWRCGIPAGLRAPSCSSPTTWTRPSFSPIEWCARDMSRANHRDLDVPFPGRVLAGKPTCGPSFRACARPSPTTCRATCWQRLSAADTVRRPRDMSIGVKRPQVDHPLLWERGRVRVLHCTSNRAEARLQHFGDFSVRLSGSLTLTLTPKPLSRRERGDPTRRLVPSKSRMASATRRWTRSTPMGI